MEWIKDNWKDIVLLAALVFTVVAVNQLGRNRPIEGLVVTWRWIMLVLILFVIVASWLVTGNPLFGWLINEQNSMSLSRLQMFLWTIVVLSAFITAVFANLHFKHSEVALDIAIPEELWLAMGISTASLAGSSLIQESKRKKEPEETSLKAKSPLKGVLVVKEKPSLLDLIAGEEAGNQGTIDLSRLQNLFFTFILVGTYAGSLGSLFNALVTVAEGGKDIAENFPIDSFPALSTTFVTLLAISHAGYLTIKAIDKQPSEPSS
jgi:hypothetical protein